MHKQARDPGSGPQRVRSLVAPRRFVPVVPPDVQRRAAEPARRPEEHAHPVWGADPAGHGDDTGEAHLTATSCPAEEAGATADGAAVLAQPAEVGGRPRHRARATARRRWAAAVLDRIPVPVRAALAGRNLDAGHAALFALLGVLAVAAAVLVLRTSAPSVEPVAAPRPAAEPSVVATGTPPSGGPPRAPAPSAAPTGPAEVLVHVAGRVRQPGVVRLPAGSRVLDAVQAAGGPADGVDLTGLNLARAVVDGEQVLVGVPAGAGDPSGSGAPGGGPAGAGAAGGGAGGTPQGGAAGGGAAAAGDPLDLNAADAAALEALPGIGPVLAGRIVAWREQNGGFRNVEELREVSGIGDRTFEALRPLVRV